MITYQSFNKHGEYHIKTLWRKRKSKSGMYNLKFKVLGFRVWWD